MFGARFIPFEDFELPMRFLLLLLLLGPCVAQADVGIIPLRFRTTEQVFPVPQPLVEPGGALSGTQGQMSSANSQRQENRRVWVKVEELK